MILLRPLLLIFSLLSILRADVSFLATVDAKQIGLNETVNFKVTVEGSEGFAQLDISQIEDFTLISGPAQSSSFQWVNGKMSSSKTLSWTLIPKRSGTLTIPALDVTIDGKRYRTEAITVRVSQGQRQPAQRSGEPQQQSETTTPLVFLTAESDKSEAYLGEQITVSYKLYTRVNLRQYSVEKQPQGIGFWMEELYAPKQPTLRDAQLEGVRYKVATLYKIALFPTTTGDLTLDPMILNCTIEVPSRSRVPSLFDDFFKRNKQQIVRSDGLKLAVKPVPAENRPADFTGAVGEFALASYLDTTSTEVNEAVSYVVELTGTGNLNLFQLEEPDFPDGLEVFNPKTSFEKDPFRDQISGKKRWEYIIIPRKEGRFFIPRSELGYLNPEVSEWKKTTTETAVLDVKPGKGIMGEGRGLTKEEIALLGQDIRYIRTGAVKLKPLSERMIPAFFWWFTIAALALFLTPRVVTSLEDGKEERSAISRSRNAMRKARRKLRKVKDPSGFHLVADAVFSYFSARLGISRAGMDSASLNRILDGRLGSDTIQDLTDILVSCDHARYAPSDLADKGKDAAAMAKRTTVLLKKIDTVL